MTKPKAKRYEVSVLNKKTKDVTTTIITTHTAKKAILAIMHYRFGYIPDILKFIECGPRCFPRIVCVHNNISFRAEMYI